MSPFKTSSIPEALSGKRSSASPGATPAKAIVPLMQVNNISIQESNTPRYDCHALQAGACPH